METKEKINQEISKELINKFKEENIFCVGENLFLIMFVGEAYKFIIGIEKGKEIDYSHLKRIAIHHHIGLECWEFEFGKGNECYINKRTLYLGG